MIFFPSFNPYLLKNKLKSSKIEFDISSFPEKQKSLIINLIECSKILGDIFLIQNYPDNLKIREKIKKLNKNVLIDFFNVMAGPYDHFNKSISYIMNIENHDQAGLYPTDLSIEEWQIFLDSNNKLKEEFISPYTVINRDNNILKAIPYSEYYKDFLKQAVIFLNNAIESAENHYLKKYLVAQKESFLNNDFDNADIKWLEMDDITILPLLGPYESYIDRFLGYKRAFTGFIGIRNIDETNHVIYLLNAIDILQKRLPIPDHYKKNKIGQTSKIEIVDMIYSSGDIRVPIHTIAFNLPNSEKIKINYGSKKVLIHNIMEAKFYSIIKPISKIILDKKDHDKVTFLSYFNFVLLHEISHELGISMIKDVDGIKREPSYFLKDLYSVIEEAKADVMSIYSLIFLLRENYLSTFSFTEISISYLLNIIRTIRFGIENSHGLSCLIQLNFCKEEKIFIFNNTSKTFSIDFHKFEKSIEKLLIIILTVQGEGDYNKTKDFINNYKNIDDDIKSILEILKDEPIDILPWFPGASEKEPFSD